jgi:hypothetical protein
LKYFIIKYKFIKSKKKEKKMTVRYLENKMVIKNLTPQLIEESIQHGYSLVAEETLPNDVYLRRWRCSPAHISRTATYINAPVSDFVFDEENESSDDYLKYCLMALEKEFDDEEKRVVKDVIMNYPHETAPWWHSSYQCHFVEFIRRENDTHDMVRETLKQIQSILRNTTETYYVSNTNDYEIIR